MAWRALLVAAVALFGAANADMCLSLPDALGPGEGCGGALSCRRGLFCHPKEGVCTRKVKVGDLCKDAVCEPGSFCRGLGDEDLARCVADVHPGQDCSSMGKDLVGNCGTGSCIDNICYGGQINDACFIDDHCIGELKCIDHICTSPLKAGDECESTDECPLKHFCDNEAKCQAYLPAGSNCTQNTSGCERGLICARRDKDATDRFCQERESLTSGQFCEDSNLCESLLCHNGHCAKETPNYCVSDQTACAVDQKCTCSSKQMVRDDDFGRCTKDRCFQRRLDYQECASENCKTNNFNSYNYFNGSCVQRNCDKLYKRQADCGSASSLSLSLSLLVAAPILSSLFSKLF